MPVMPKRTKYRKMQKGRNRGKATRGNVVNEGQYGLQTTEAGLITANQIEAARIAMTRYIKRGGKVWIKIFPMFFLYDLPSGLTLYWTVSNLFSILQLWLQKRRGQNSGAANTQTQGN